MRAVRSWPRGAPHRAVLLRWAPVLLLLVATLGPQVPHAAAASQVGAPVAFGAASGDQPVVAALVRPTGVVAVRGDERAHLAVAAVLPAAAMPSPWRFAIGPAAQPSYDVLAGVPVAPTSRGPPAKS
jgi:hypothetical protein